MVLPHLFDSKAFGVNIGTVDTYEAWVLRLCIACGLFVVPKGMTMCETKVMAHAALVYYCEECSVM